MGYAGIFELLWDLSFIPHRLEYLYHFLHHGCDTCFVHFGGGGGIASGPGTLPGESCLMAFWNSQGGQLIKVLIELHLR